MARESNNSDGRPAAPRLNIYNPSGFVSQLQHLREAKGAQFGLWSAVVERRPMFMRELIEGELTATFANLVSVARIAAVLNVRNDWTTDHPLPPIDADITVADVHRLIELAPHPITKQWAQRRLQQLLAAAAPATPELV